MLLAQGPHFENHCSKQRQDDVELQGTSGNQLGFQTNIWSGGFQWRVCASQGIYGGEAEKGVRATCITVTSK